MTLDEFTAYCARYGVPCAITPQQYAEIDQATIDEKYGIACDLNAGLTWERAVYINYTAKRESEKTNGI